MVFMLVVIPKKSDFVEPDLIVVPNSSRGLRISVPPSKYEPRAGTTRMFSGISGSYTHTGIDRFSLLLSVSNRYKATNNFIVVVRPSAVAKVTLIG